MDALKHIQAYGLAILGVFAISLSVLTDRERMHQDLQGIYEAVMVSTLFPGGTSDAARREGLERIRRSPAPVTLHDQDGSAIEVAYARGAAEREAFCRSRGAHDDFCGTGGYHDRIDRDADGCARRSVWDGVFRLNSREARARFTVDLIRIEFLRQGPGACVGDAVLELHSRQSPTLWGTDQTYSGTLDQIADRRELVLTPQGYFQSYQSLIRRYKAQIAQVPLLNISPNFRVASLLLATVSLALGLTLFMTLNRERPAEFPMPPAGGKLAQWILRCEVVFWRGFLLLLSAMPALTAMALALMYRHETDAFDERVAVFAFIPLGLALLAGSLARFGFGGGLLRIASAQNDESDEPLGVA